MLTVLLIRPCPSAQTIGLQHLMIVEPLELEVLGALTPPHRPIIVDMILEKKPFSHFIKRYRPDVICITGYITHVGIMIEYCAESKRIDPRVVTVVGGVHCEVCPQDFDHPSVDYRVVRNATSNFNLLLKHIHDGAELPGGILRKTDNVENTLLPTFDFSFPLPDRYLTAKYRSSYFYIFHDRVALLKTSFGCPHHCRFCFCKAITGGRYSVRPMEDVIQDLEKISEQNIYIVDDDFLAVKDRLLSFINEIVCRGIRKKYLVYGRADFIADNPEVMALFKDAGLKTIIVGFESFFDGELKSYNKGTTGEINKKAMHVLSKLRIDCYATIIIPPHWDHERFMTCTSTLKSLGIHYVNVQPLTPLPGTGMMVPENNLLIGRSEYEKWDLAHVSINPEKMSVTDFYRHIVAMYDSIVFQPKILWKYLRNYHFLQLYKMALGSMRVRRQYKRNIREAIRREKGLSDA